MNGKSEKAEPVYRFMPGDKPVLISCPHVGTHVPEDIHERFTDAGRLLADTDWHVDWLYGESAGQLGCSLLTATHSRYVIDLNRAPDNRSLYSGANNTELCPITTFDEEPIYNEDTAPDDAEVHYLAHTVEECHWYFDAIKKDAFGWAFTANHANLVPDGVDGFLKAFGVDRIGCVRLADNVGTVEVHMIPGEGNIDFKSMFHRLEGAGYGGHYTMAYGTPVQKLESRDWLVEQAGQ